MQQDLEILSVLFCTTIGMTFSLLQCMLQLCSISHFAEIWYHLLQFVDLFGDIEAIKKAELRHRQLFPPRKSTVESKKRPSLDNAGPDRAKIHKTYNVVQATPTPVGPPVYNNGQTQWNSGAYAPQVGYQQPQGWQQPPPQQPAPQVQPPQWNQGYGGPQVSA